MIACWIHFNYNQAVEAQVWSLKAAQELEQATQAELAGNTGKARVCARRCAGWILRIAGARQGLPFQGLNAYQLISIWAEQSTIPERARKILKEMLIRVDADGGFPQGINLVASCTELADLLSIDIPKIPK